MQTYHLFIRHSGKMIISLKPLAIEHIDTRVRDAAQAECVWNTDSIVTAIRQHTAV
ncbi:hypothetical protein [Pseudomonas sp. PSB11]|jgi:hypothetical protein|uniref:hypothetical protein n=1 Tax=Pseudomonas sp. PSB11 TaxID=2021969 RepID=UPI0016606FEE|nr:hypothetical protein [Pseudomonas sp. PSB11]MDP9690679.1 hypothetical protein [Pseudomonas mohnii]